jgi:N-acetyl-anhydromuramyl-L-alanine amidase AmpD
LDQVNALVMHRTDSATADSALRSFASGRDGVQYGTHFLIDKDGTVYQTASLQQRTAHVGRIKSRCVEEDNCAADDRALTLAQRWNPGGTHNHEKTKPYPQRYPLNEDSVGIEVVGRHVDGKWEAPTAAQQASINRLVNTLQQHYQIGDRDVHAHDVISYKTAGEGAGLYTPAVEPEPERLQQPPGISR